MTLASLLPGATLHHPYFGVQFDSGWTHFLAYTVAAVLSMLVWKRRTGFVFALGISFVSVVLQILRGWIAGHPTDLYGTVINLLGIAAGVLLGLNIIALRAHASRPLAPSSNRSRSDHSSTRR